MQTIINTISADTLKGEEQCETSTSAVAWSAVFAGAFIATAVSLTLLLLGSGFGLASISPWSQSGVSALTFTATAAIWLVIMQWIASALGGYLTGRLRSKWKDMQTDEIFFRDTAHGFLAWALATVFAAAFLASTISSVVGVGASALSNVAVSRADGSSQQSEISGSNDPISYFVDSLYRSDRVNLDASENDVRDETNRILVSGIRNSNIPDADKTYLSKLVASRTGLSQVDATKRVEEVIGKMNVFESKLRQAADTARKTASTISIFTALSMLIGAFIASVAAALGGRHRDA